jgi:hypothetical protein
LRLEISAELLRRHRLAEIIPDSFVTIVRPQKLQAFKRLNTLGDGPQVVLDASSETAPPLL